MAGRRLRATRERAFAAVRRALSLDVETAAARLRISPGYLRGLEQGRHPLTQSLARRMANAYGKSTRDLLTRP